MSEHRTMDTTVSTTTAVAQNATAAGAATKAVTMNLFDVAFYFIIAKCCLSLVIIFTNGMTVYVLKQYIKHLNAVHMTMAYLAIADLVFALNPWVKGTVYFIHNHNWWERICIFSSWLNVFSIHWNFQAIILIAIERYFLIARPQFHQKHFSQSKLKYVFLTGFAIMLLTLIIYICLSDVDVIRSHGACRGLVTRNKFPYWFLLLSLYFIYTLILFVSYVRIMIFIWKKKMGMTAGPLGQDRFKKEKRTTIEMIAIVTVYIVVTIPNLTKGVILLDDHTDMVDYIKRSLGFLWYLQAIVNPLIYTLKIPAFKEAYGKMFGRICKRRKGNRVNVINVQRYNVNDSPLEPRRNVENTHN